MRPRRTQALSLSLTLLLVAAPTLASGPGFIGVGRSNGPVEINGMAFRDGTNLYSGDHLHTGSRSQLMLLMGPREKSVLAPDSTVRLHEEGDFVILALAEGKLRVHSAGRTQIALESLHLRIHPLSNSASETAVEILNERQASVSAVDGPVQIAGGQASFLLDSGETALLTDNSLAALPPDRDARMVRRRDLSIVIVAGAIGATEAIHFIFFSRKQSSPDRPRNDQ
jgi:hypothetical protein